MSQQINLFNPIFKQQKKYLSAVTISQALGLIVLGAALLGSYAAYRSSRLADEAAATSRQLQATQEQLAKVAVAFPLRQKSPAVEQEIKQAEAEMASLQKVSEVLRTGELGNTKGYADYLRAFARQIIDGVWLTGFRIYGAGSEIELQGRALRPELMPIYISRLKNEPVLQGKSFSTLEMRVPERPESKNVDAASKPASNNFIEFTLQSTGLATPDGTGAQAK